jgi:hypothetical protein
MDGDYLVHVSFTNTAKLDKPTYLFSYRGHQFKITRTRRRGYADNFLTIVETEEDINRVARIAAEFFSALAWATKGHIQFGNPTWVRIARAGDLRSVRASIFDFQRIPPGREIAGHNISSIPHIENERQRLALALYREAGASNNVYLEFLFLWQVLSVGTAGGIGAANKARKLIRDTTWVDELDLKGKSIGNYFDNDCRNAIAHVIRPPGETTLDFDDPDDRRRISSSVRAVRVFARHHIEHRLELNKSLWLFKNKSGSIPEYRPVPARR